jgi:hypothetical protein
MARLIRSDMTRALLGVALMGWINLAAIVVVIEKGMLTSDTVVTGLFFCYILGAAAFLWGTRRYWTRHDGPHCGVCGYPLRGLESLRCPECGHDGAHEPFPVRRVVNTRARRTRYYGLVLQFAPMIVCGASLCL